MRRRPLALPLATVALLPGSGGEAFRRLASEVVDEQVGVRLRSRERGSG